MIGRDLAIVIVPTAVIVIAAIMIFVMSMSVSVSMSVVAIAALTSVMGDVFVVVPVVPHKVDGSAASMVLGAMFAPVFLMSRWDVQVDRLGRNILRRSLNHHGLRIDNRRPRDISNINLSVEARLPDADGYAYVCGERGSCEGSQQCCA